ncbi:SusC/RagA family TonB-linked outer membrane protein [Capnocytophaga catalasegens]|uniref:SusC/RagA family TonB-linked outer membrane protein n=1 Tax=Capnocytophaga catalasegens TaxID=1004260 RepID=A0AAV5AV76_9FLAO|nr:SusC/RagA family TonB-linked outer membrane protein [Capnocytophaga catalasegens]GIZ15952.1 SusC/RagA family TonB-linked outer membrane protein [Capnocytophaga catalasegens]GJM50439.1 SusC/RagA family TonB-linked outer membrane protein [Capnocytophaga catalasegens]GJM53934.1 SusC/RagA family TonB-linked outer membrane protein [Capnocytophaga catalasegens]
MKGRLLAFFFFFVCTIVWGQKEVTGVVKDSQGAPLPGVGVVVKGTSIGVSTDFDGNYKIKVPNETSVLVFSTLGMQTQEKVVGSNKTLNIVLQEDVLQIGEVVVTGYQEINRKSLTGAVQTLKADQVKMDGIVDVGRMLEGRAAGVNVQNITGTFGAAPKITIRGGSSIFGDTKPLWVVDGAVQEEVVNLTFDQLASGDSATLVSSAISGLNANDIQSIEILKDASALSLYGARALNGAVIITTKSGKRNSKTSISYQLEQSVRSIPNYGQYDILNSQETMAIYKELEDKGHFSLSSHTQGRYGGVYNIYYRAINTYNPITGSFMAENTDAGKIAFLKKYEYANTDWFKTLFRYSLTQNHTLSMSGGGENSTQYASIGFFIDPGWTIADRISRITGNLKSNYTLSPSITVGMLVQGAIRKQKVPGTYGNRSGSDVTGEYKRDFDINPFSYALNTSRTLRPYSDNGEYEYYRYNYASMNILKELENNYMDLNVLEIKFQGDLEAKLTKNLKYNFLGSVRYVKSTNEHSITKDSNIAGAHRANETTIVANQNPFLFKDPDNPNAIPQVVLPNGGILKNSEDNLQTYYFRNAFEYKNLFKDVHNVKLYLGQEYRHTDRYNSNSIGYGYQFDKGGVPFTDYRIIQKYLNDASDYFGRKFNYERGIAFFLQSTYSYDERYVFSGTANYEGSNKLGRSTSARWLPTWNMSARWNASNEKFLKTNETLSTLAFRFSYGLIAGLGSASNALAIFKSGIANRYYGNNRENRIYIEELQNEELTWEKVYETNFGTEVGFFNNRINLSIDLYQKNSKDLIDYVRTSGVGGQHIKLANNASMTTKGLEFSLLTRNIKTDDFAWNTTVNFAFFDQKITHLKYQPNVFDLVREFGGNVEGEARNTLYSFDFTELDSNGLPNFKLKEGKNYLKDIDFQDNQNILTYLKKEGPVDPNITGGFSNTFTYKNWEFSFLITAQAGNKIRKTAQYAAVYNDLDVFPTEFKNRWLVSGDEKITNIPAIPSRRLLSQVGESNLVRLYNAYNHSTERVVDGSFVRMKNISLSYSFDKDTTEKLRINNLTLRLQASNPFLIYSDKRLNGQDPEFFRSGGVAYPVTSQYTLTVNLGI